MTLLRHRLFWPSAALIVLLLGNLIFTPHFFSIELRNGQLYGSLIDILRLSAPLILVSLGMTLVIATGGIDLSVGSVMAVAGALACSIVVDRPDISGVLLACAAALALALALGLWNGFLVSVVGLQPIIATLILMVAGRGLAQLITEGQIITVNSPPYRFIGAGYLLTFPFAVIIAAVVVALVALITRRTALGLLVESVGGNPRASRLSGIHSRRLIWGVYAFTGVAAGIAGLMATANVSSADGNAVGSLIELNAILAVVIGGTSLAGGRFSIAGTVVGALLIQALDTTIYTTGVPAQTTQLFKAVVVIAICLIQSPVFRRRVFRTVPA
ncbi:ABC transporter permease [Actinoplanes sp. NPDC051470]|uniref:ABC transporter permease n=1 Tax=unclassified Actinoplanes TaxID=2626549 RepID=UPI003442A609